MNHYRIGLLTAVLVAGSFGDAQSQVETRATQEPSSVSSQALNIRNLLSRFDTDGNGELSVLERARVRQFIQKQNAQRESEANHRVEWQDVVQRYDADGDGVLNAAERQSALNTIRELVGRETQDVSIKEELISRLDVNRDGRVDALERRLLTTQIDVLRESAGDEAAEATAASDPVARPTLDRATLINRFDLNQDGRVDAEERVLARQIILQGGLTEPTGELRAP